MLILSEIYYPGWRVTVNGEYADIYKVDGALRGVMVPKGKSRVVMKYIPVSGYLGAGLSLLTTACLLLAFFVSRRRDTATVRR